MPTSADIYLMKIVGYNILFRITKTVIETFLYGAFMVIFFATITTMIRRGLQSWPSIIIFSITIVNFVLVSTVWTCHVVLFVRTVKYCLMDQTAATFNSKTMADLNELYWRYDIALTVFEQLMLTLSDSVVIWRAWVLVPRRWIMAPPILLVVGSTACAFAYVAIESTNFRWYIVHTNIKLSLVDLMMDASLALSFLANTWTTLLITHTLWLHMRFWKTLKLHKKPPKVLKVLVILIDTGLAFLLLQGLNILFSFLPFNHYTAFDFFQAAIFGAYTLLTGMYPTVVIYLVNQQRCLVEVFVLSDAKGNGTPELEIAFDRTITIGPLAFAHPDTSVDVTSPTDISNMDFTDTDEGSCHRSG